MKPLTEKARVARSAYKKEWARKNADKVREYQRRYWEKRAAEIAEEPEHEQEEK